MHTRINSLGLFFSCAQIDLRKARERELATALDEKSTSNNMGLLNPIELCAIKNSRQEPGGRRDDACDQKLVHKLESKTVRKKKKKQGGGGGREINACLPGCPRPQGARTAPAPRSARNTATES